MAEVNHDSIIPPVTISIPMPHGAALPRIERYDSMEQEIWDLRLHDEMHLRAGIEILQRASWYLGETEYHRGGTFAREENEIMDYCVNMLRGDLRNIQRWAG